MFYGKNCLIFWIITGAKKKRICLGSRKVRLKHRHADLWQRIVQRCRLDLVWRSSNGWCAASKQPHLPPEQSHNFWHISHWHIFGHFLICGGKADYCVQVPRLESATGINQYVNPFSVKSDFEMSFYSHPKVCWNIVHPGCRENPWERQLDIAWSIWGRRPVLQLFGWNRRYRAAEESATSCPFAISSLQGRKCSTQLYRQRDRPIFWIENMATELFVCSAHHTSLLNVLFEVQIG